MIPVVFVLSACNEQPVEKPRLCDVEKVDAVIQLTETCDTSRNGYTSRVNCYNDAVRTVCPIVENNNEAI